MSPRKMKTPDLVRLTIAVGILSVVLCAPIAYAGIADDAIDAAQRVERLSIIGVLTCGIITAWGAFFWLLRIVFQRDSAERKELAEIIQGCTAAMQSCHDERQRKERGR